MDSLLAVPNVSEGRDQDVIAELRSAFDAPGVELLLEHSDSDHNRSVFTLAGSGSALIWAILAGAERARELIDMSVHAGAHPCVGALDVAPIVYPNPTLRAEATDVARQLIRDLGAIGVPVFAYGDLASDTDRRERAFYRRGGAAALRERVQAGELTPDAGPAEIDPAVGATLVTARPPLGAFNVELRGGGLKVARQIAARLREAGGGLPGVRAIGIELESGVAQVSTNVEDLVEVPLGEVVERIRALAGELGTGPAEAELVGLVPEAAVADYPEDVPIRGFDPDLHLIERRI